MLKHQSLIISDNYWHTTNCHCYFCKQNSNPLYQATSAHKAIGTVKFPLSQFNYTHRMISIKIHECFSTFWVKIKKSQMQHWICPVLPDNNPVKMQSLVLAQYQDTKFLKWAHSNNWQFNINQKNLVKQ